jgi:hypothetical protein
MECGVYIGHLTRGDHDQQLRAAAYLREQLCSPSGNIAGGLVEAGAVSPLALLLQDGPAEAKVGRGQVLGTGCRSELLGGEGGCKTQQRYCGRALASSEPASGWGTPGAGVGT